MTHLTRQDLEHWCKEGQPADRERIVAHLAECDACGLLYGEVVDSEPVLADELEGVDPDVIARGYRAYQSQPAHIGPFPARLVLAYGAAALVLAVILVPALRQSMPQRAPDADAVRGSSLQPLAPIGEVRPPVQFRWASPIEAARFRVAVRQEDEQVVFVLSTAVERVDLQPDHLAMLTRGRAYVWEVVALDAAGEVVMRAPPQRFAVARD